MAKPSSSPHIHWADLLSLLLSGLTGKSLCCWGSHLWEGFPFPHNLRVEWYGGICSWMMLGRFMQSLQAMLEFFVPQSASYRETPGTMEVSGGRGGQDTGGGEWSVSHSLVPFRMFPGPACPALLYMP